MSPSSPPSKPKSASASSAKREPSPSPAPDKAPSEASTEDSDEGIIDMEVFDQIIELDEEDDHEFSKQMAWAYFAQAASTFDDMNAAYAEKDLKKLSELGHFLKGSSAALGVAKVQQTCEKLQHYGQLRDEEEGTDLTRDAALAKIGPLLKQVKREYDTAERWLRKWYKEHGGDEDPVDA